jgi:hypothetical protein
LVPNTLMGMGGAPGRARKIRMESFSWDPDRQCCDRLPSKRMGKRARSSGTGPRAMTPADDMLTGSEGRRSFLDCYLQH